MCWDPSGEYLASVSEDLAKVWKVGSGGKGDCINELNCNGKIFHTCVFHPTNTSLLIIGSHEVSRGRSKFMCFLLILLPRFGNFLWNQIASDKRFILTVLLIMGNMRIVHELSLSSAFMMFQCSSSIIFMHSCSY